MTSAYVRGMLDEMWLQRTGEDAGTPFNRESPEFQEWISGRCAYDDQGKGETE